MQFVFIWIFQRKAAEKMPVKRLKNIRSLLHLMLPIWKRHIIWTIKWNLKSKMIRMKWAAESFAAHIFKEEMG